MESRSPKINPGDEQMQVDENGMPVRILQLAGPLTLTKKERKKVGFADNTITTSKYTWYNFIPKSLFEQFRRIANFYFLLSAILQLVGYWTPLYKSPYNGVSTAGTLGLMLLVTMVMQLRDDIARHTKDKEVNCASATVIDPDTGERVTKQWCDIAVGDFVLVLKNQPFPADLILLASSHADGVCYVETKNIDGETNLKLRNAVRAVHDKAHAIGKDDMDEVVKAASKLRGTVRCDPPNAQIYAFNGAMNITSTDPAPASNDPVPLSNRNILLRGSKLMNTEVVLAACVYTGKDTKVVRNASSTPSKMSNLDLTVNKLLLIVLITQFILVFVSAVGATIWKFVTLADKSEYWYLFEQSERFFGPEAEGVLSNITAIKSKTKWYYSPGIVLIQYCFTFLALYNSFVPISLYVTLEMVNVIQALLINKDLKMYDADTDIPALCRSSNLCPELGQVEYVFSDKTGTLTQNVMCLKAVSIAGKIYNSDDGSGKITRVDSSVEVHDVDDNGDKFRCQALSDDLSERDHEGTISNFLSVLAVAHTVVINQNNAQEDASEGKVDYVSAEENKKAEDTKKLDYEAESPDELALVEGASGAGLTFSKRSETTVECVDHRGEVQSFEILAINEFNSDRKRMSVVARYPDDSLHVLCKGADNKLLERADDGDYQELQKHLYDFACEGLRTLVIGHKELTEDEWAAWHERYEAASISVNGRDEKMAAAAEELEQNFHLLGATAIEDKLQENVAETIHDIHKADIKLWVLTGDKLETAINIGYSCKVLLTTMEVHQVQILDTNAAPGEIEDSIRLQLCQVAIRMQLCEESMSVQDSAAILPVSASPVASPAEQKESTDELPSPSRKFQASMDELVIHKHALVITGPCLKYILQNQELSHHLLLPIGQSCGVVIACRVSPAQKAQLVELVQKGVTPRPVTLAIGDGANDVPMLQKAQVGVGISGLEGRQAVNSSDFAISKFKFLRRLLLIHGRWDYRRQAKVILFSFYKNIVLTMISFLYAFANGFSGTSIYDQYMYMMFNIVCATPIIAIGVFDQDLSERAILKYPEMYISGRLGLDINITKFMNTVLFAIIHGCIIFYWPMLAYRALELNGHGGLWCYGTVVYACMVSVVTTRSAVITYTWTVYNAVTVVASMVILLLLIPLLSALFPLTPEYYGAGWQAMSDPLFWFLMVATSLTALAFDIILENLRLQFKPTVVDLGREIDLKKFQPQSELSSGALIDDQHNLFDKLSKTLAGSESTDHRTFLCKCCQCSTSKRFRTRERLSSSLVAFKGTKELVTAARAEIGAAPMPKPTSGFAFDFVEKGPSAPPAPAAADDSENRPPPVKNSLLKRLSCSQTVRMVLPASSSSRDRVGTITVRSEAHAAAKKERAELKAMKAKNANRPSDHPIFQQTLRGNHPVMQLRCVGWVLLTIAIIFFALGAPVLVLDHNGSRAATQELMYSGGDVKQGHKDTKHHAGSSWGDLGMFYAGLGDQQTVHDHHPKSHVTCSDNQCVASFYIPPPGLKAPIRVFYQLDRFYQNYQSYAGSTSSAQWVGNFDESQFKSRCPKTGDGSGYSSTKDKRKYWPCGLRGNSMFWDKIALSNTDVDMSEEGIAWQTDMDRFKNAPCFNNPNCTQQWRYIDETYARTPLGPELAETGIRNEHFIVWMRLAAFSGFRKLFGIIREDIKVENENSAIFLNFTITDTFPVKSFKGSKSIVIAPNLFVTSENSVVASAVILFGSLSLAFSIALFVQSCTCKRNLRDHVNLKHS